MIMDGNFYIGTCAIDLTYKCTFRCLHCFNSSGEHSLNKQELSDAEILQFIDDINNYSVGLISIGGGEALLRKELILQISDYLSGNNSKIDLALVTNGYLMTKPYDYVQYLLEEILKHMDDRDCSFLEDLLPWSEKLPAEIRKV